MVIRTKHGGDFKRLNHAKRFRLVIDCRTCLKNHSVA
uniref:Uncharacterized protein n=1 Tax=Tetranychus urticae TaxID=32264 RepID=T1L1G8_TETUR